MSRLSISVLLAILTAVPITAQAQEHSGAFVIRLGTDTTAVERFSRSGNAYNVEQVLRSPATSQRHTHLELTPAGEIGTIFLMLHQIGDFDAPLLGSTQLTRSGDSATVTVKQGEATRTRQVAAGDGMIPSLPQSFLPYELAAMRLRSSARDSMTVTLLSAGGGTTPVIVRRLGADSMTFELPFLTYRARVDSRGRVLSLYQPLGTNVERVTGLEINRVAEAWKAEDDAGRGMGPLSPLDSASARVGNATVAVRYSRPSVRGRPIWGSLVPFDSIWRTGANAATVLETDRDIVVGGIAVPAGRYSLFTIPSSGGTTLVINSETERDGQPLAGTAYDEEHDLARIPMSTATTDVPVEQFTIEILPGEERSGVLRLTWDRRQMTVPVEVR